MAGPGGGGGGGWTPARSVAGDRNPWAIVGVISIATFMVVLDSSIANVALAHIAGSLSASYDEATWVLTSFLVANAVIIPISGWLADVIGRKRYYMISIALFTGSSLLCGLAPNLTTLILARILQGIGGGGLAPVEQSMLVDTFPPQKRSLAFAAYGIVVIAGPVIGPSLGGVITDNLSWHWVFLINGPIGLLSLFLVNMFVDEPKAMVEHRLEKLKGGLKVDIVGFLLVALFLGGLEVTLDRGQREDWFSSSFIVTFAVISAVALIAFIPWELSRKDPIVKIRMFGHRNFAIASLFLMITGMIIFGTTQFIPQMLQQVIGYTATDAGFALTAGGVATILVMPVAGVLSSKVDPRYLVGFAFMVQGLALWNMTHLNTDIAFHNAAFARMYQSLGLPFLFVPITAIAYVGLPPDESNQASALMNVARNLGGTMGISLTQSLLANRQQVHQSQLVEGLQPLNGQYQASLAQATGTLMGQGQTMAQANSSAIGQIYREALKQASMLSYLDCFHVMMLVVFCALPLVLLMQKPPKLGGAPGGAA